MTTDEILDRAADLLEPDGAWCQRTWARNDVGHGTSPTDDDAVCWCAEGAIRKIGWQEVGSSAVREADKALLAVLKRNDIAKWNDFPTRRQTTVVAALRKAAEIARAEASR